MKNLSNRAVSALTRSSIGLMILATLAVVGLSQEAAARPRPRPASSNADVCASQRSTWNNAALTQLKSYEYKTAGKGQPYSGRRLYYRNSYNNWVNTSDCATAVSGFQL